MITIIDYGMGNVGSIKNTLNRQRINSIITSNPEDILNAEKLILPGVGKFDHGMKCLDDLGLIESLNTAVIEEHTPILGICLGMQLFTRHSEEGNISGLGWFDAKTVKFRFDVSKQLKIPHMGWNSIFKCKETPLFLDIPLNNRFYFVHSYHVDDIPEANILGKSEYGRTFPSVIQKDNIYGIQPHPERSHNSGVLFLKNFAGLENV